MPTRPIVAGNWKMHLSHSEAHELAWNCDQIAFGHPTVQVAIFPTSIYVGEIARMGLVDGTLLIGAQNCHSELEGAFTGEVSPSQLVSAGIGAVLIGHSERRSQFGEDDAVLSRKLAAALGVGLHVIYCIGETLAQRDAGQASAIVIQQLAALAGLKTDNVLLDVAYEPVWAIGTGRTATPKIVAEMAAAIRAELDRLGLAGARLLYGGSVNPDNASELARVDKVDGFLVGGASLSAESFLAIVKATADSQG